MPRHGIWGSIPDDHIRLLYVHIYGSRRQPWKGSRISYRLVVVPLSEIIRGLQSYIALSYCWDPPLDDNYIYGKRLANNDGGRRMIEVNTVHVEIGQNLYDLLLELVDQGETSALWIDALCINQADNVEKSHQVAMMGDIYRRATRVISWIGRLPTNSPDQFKLRDDDGQFSREALELFDHRLYWYRAWTFQETVLARRLDIQIGPHVLPWSSFINIYLRSAEQGRLHDNIVAVEEQRSDLDGIATLVGAVCNIWTREARDPRDKVFAILSLLTYPAPFSADYAMPLEDLMIHVVKTCITDSQLAFIHLAASDDNEREDYLPSWVPPWHNSNPGAQVLGRLEDIKRFDILDLHAIDEHAVPFATIQEVEIELSPPSRLPRRTDIVSEFHTELHIDGFAVGMVESVFRGSDLTAVLASFPQCIVPWFSLRDRVHTASSTRKRAAPIVFDIVKQMQRLQKHRLGQCNCPRVRFSEPSIPYSVPSESQIASEDWIVILFGTNSEVILRPYYGQIAKRKREDGLEEDQEQDDWDYYFELVADGRPAFDDPDGIAQQTTRLLQKPAAFEDKSGVSGVANLSYLRGTFKIR